MPAPSSSFSSEIRLSAPVRWVVVLCADWCGTCRGYREVLEDVVGRFDGWQAAWIDIEDQSELVDELDVETFPTVLIYEQAAVQPSDADAAAQADRLFFFGPMLPHAGTLQRQMELLVAPDAVPSQPLPAELRTLAAWLRQTGSAA